MELTSLRCRLGSHDGRASILVDDGTSYVEARHLAEPVGGDAMDVLSAVTPVELERRFEATDGHRLLPVVPGALGPPYRRPRKLLGIGLNYREHADDLGSAYPGEPASFLKGDHTIIGPDEPIPLPGQSQRVTAEAELGLVIGRYCRNVEVPEALSYVWGVCPVLDQTAEDILQRNPRFLTRAKNFPGFFSFGPAIVPLAAVLEQFGSLAAVEVITAVGAASRSNSVANMIFPPEFLVSFHSKVMPLYPGDIVSTGTPGALVIAPGDVAQCRIPGIGALSNPVLAAAQAKADGLSPDSPARLHHGHCR